VLVKEALAGWIVSLAGDIDPAISTVSVVFPSV
jgi:hypothetical protein